MTELVGALVVGVVVVAGIHEPHPNGQLDMGAVDQQGITTATSSCGGGAMDRSSISSYCRVHVYGGRKEGQEETGKVGIWKALRIHMDVAEREGNVDSSQ